MLQQLSIENYALIKELNISFASGFSVITGETGAGKSIILGALGLILGQRADTQTLLDKEKKCIVEGTFNIENLSLSDFFAAQDLDYENTTVLRREITPNGKSRAFINDTPVSLQQLKTLGEYLVDIHSQHKTLTLNESSFQLELLDTFGNNPQIWANYTQIYSKYTHLTRELKLLEEKQNDYNASMDYNRFLFDELNEAKLLPNEQEEAEKALELQEHAENIKSGLFQIENSLNESESSVISQLHTIRSLFSKIAPYHALLEQLDQRIQSSLLELKDILHEVENLNEEIQHSPETQEQLSIRLDIIYRLQKKHHVNSVEELLSIFQELEHKLNDSFLLGEQIENLQKELLETEITLKKASNSLSELRKTSAKTIEERILPALLDLGMANACLKVQFTQSENYTSTGKDIVTFLFNANKGGTPLEIAKVASGGELSRLMLAIKSLVTQKTLLPTIVFDEIDSGVSGEISGKVANMMLQISQHMQVISITHLPQIAAKADTHFKVYKREENEKTISNIKQLSKDEQIEEIAKMLSSGNVSQAAIETAKELMK